MRLKLPERFSLSVPARKVVLLPDAHFFCRAVPVAAGARPAEVAAQMELALEALAPFPLAQMYHGHFWRPGAKNACVFAAYRKRFPAGQVETWAEVEAVLPAFASMLNLKLEEPSTLLLWSEKSLTAVSWDDVGDAPVSVLSRELPPEPTDSDRAVLREDLLRESGGGRAVIESTVAPELDHSKAGDGFVFRSGQLNSACTREQLDVLDVRDKEELAARRRARARDLFLWRALMACAAAILLAVILEGALVGGRIWQKKRLVVVERQEPYVTKIRLAQNLATQIEELSTRRMHPFEMISMVAEKKPASVTFISAAVTNPDLFTLDLEAQAATSADVDAFRSALNSMAGCEKVEFKGSRLVNGLTTFRLAVTFKPEAFNPVPSS